MRILIYVRMMFVFILFTANVSAVVPERTGWWKFDDPSNLTKAESGFGTDLLLHGSHSAVDGPEQGNGAVSIGPGSYYTMDHMISPNGGGSFVNEYTLAYDFKITNNTIWHCFFQTTVNNSNDGDFFINPTGNIGVAATGYSSYVLGTDDWYRMVISVKNGSFFNCYLDGDLFMSGNTQTIDGRFSLNNLLLIFADNDGEDGTILCSELSIWNIALNAEEAKEMGGFGHYTALPVMTRFPYLHPAGQNSITICWHDTSSAGTHVDYGKALNLGQTHSGTSEIISPPYRWHSVKLTGLDPDTKYYYKVVSGNGESQIYSFKTLPDETYTGKIRFVLLSDTHASDTTMAGNVLRAAKAKITELYGPDTEEHINGIFHSGDVVVSGNSPGQYTSQYFQIMSPLSANIPTAVVAGNHEGESEFFYNYLKLDDQSVFPANPSLKEKVWQIKIGNALFIGLNTNITGNYGTTMLNWIDTRLNEAQSDPSIDFVYLFFHHPPYSELWFVVNTFDGGSNWVRDLLFPVIKKYSKVQQIHTGHTHGFERGAILSPTSDGDFRIICGGGGGGPTDKWGDFENFDYPDVQISYDHYFFQILEIDIANHSYENSMYSLGNSNKPRNTELMDKWYKKLNQPGPQAPTVESYDITENQILFQSSQFVGYDSVMSVQSQVLDGDDISKVIINTMVHRTNIYGVDQNFIPRDLNKDINLFKSGIERSKLSWNKSYYFRVRYRDHNLKWSNWSEPLLFEPIGTRTETLEVADYYLRQNYPNPFNKQTIIEYNVPELSQVDFHIYDIKSRMVANISEGLKEKGNYKIDYNAEYLNEGVYYYQLVTGKYSSTRKMIKIL